MLVRGWSRSKHRKTKHMLLSCPKNAGQNCDMKTANRFFQNEAKFKFLGMAPTNQNVDSGGN